MSNELETNNNEKCVRRKQEEIECSYTPRGLPLYIRKLCTFRQVVKPIDFGGRDILFAFMRLQFANAISE